MSPQLPSGIKITQDSSKFYLDFNFGFGELRNGFDISRFSVYQKADSIHRSESLFYKANMVSLNVGEQVISGIHKKGVQEYNYRVLFYKDKELHERWTPGDTIQSVSLRKRWESMNFNSVVVGDEGVAIVSTQKPLFALEGTALINYEPRSKNRWTKIGNDISFKEPIRLSNLKIVGQFSMTVQHREVCEPDNNDKRLKRLYEEQNSGDNRFVELPPYQLVFTDREIYESDVFSGGKISTVTADTQKNIRYQQSGKKYVAGNKKESSALVFAYSLTVPSSGKIYASLPTQPEESSIKYFILEFDHSIPVNWKKGSLSLFTESIDIAGDHIEATIVSDFYKVNNKWQVLLKTGIRGSIVVGTLFKEGLYFYPYAAEISNWINAINFDEGTPHKSLYFGVTSIDDAGNESLLGNIAQHRKIRPAPGVAPSKPYKVVPGEMATVGYCSPPDNKGNASVKIGWRSAGNQLRYELARASQQSILLTYERNWFLTENAGIAGEHSKTLPAGDFVRFGRFNDEKSSQRIFYVRLRQFEEYDLYVDGKISYRASGKYHPFKITRLATELSIPGNEIAFEVMTLLETNDLFLSDQATKTAITVESKPTFAALTNEQLILTINTTGR